MIVYYFLFVFLIYDIAAFVVAKYPRGTPTWWSWIPGGGFFALIWYGRRDN